MLTNKERVFSDPWLTAPRRPEPEHHLSESISGTTRFIPERGREATTTISTFSTVMFYLDNKFKFNYLCVCGLGCLLMQNSTSFLFFQLILQILPK